MVSPPAKLAVPIRDALLPYIWHFYGTLYAVQYPTA